MPFTNLEQITPILSEIKRLKPKSILDVGCGIGVYGFLCRIYLDLYGDDENFMKKLKNRSSNPWHTKIDAIEGFKDYLEFIPDWAYDNIVVDSALKSLSKIPDRQYDLVLALGILEHFTKPDGIVFLNEIKRVGKKAILSVPKEWKEQVVPENDLETHRSHWTQEELISFGFNRFLPHPFVWIAVFECESHTETQEIPQEICILSKKAVFNNNLGRFIYKLLPVSPETKPADFFIKKPHTELIQLGHKNLPDDIFHVTSEKWAMRYRTSRRILAFATVRAEEDTLFIEYVSSEKKHLRNIMIKLENLTAKRGLKYLKVTVSPEHCYMLERYGYR